MSSNALQVWKNLRSGKLDEIRSAHRAIGGQARGRRYATEQINQAYAMLLSSQFQGFCRDLHSECIDHFARAIPPTIASIVSEDLALHRQLDRGNPNSGNIGADFNRFGIRLWDEVIAREPQRNQSRKTYLDELCIWRNAIAHQDFDPAKLSGRIVLPLSHVRRWRKACGKLAESFDRVMRESSKVNYGDTAVVGGINMQSTQESAPKFEVGDRVSFPIGRGTVWAVVVEDRGPIGVGGRRLYRIRTDEIGTDEAMTIEKPESELQVAQKLPQLKHDEVISYLEYGGLIAILRSNFAGGRHQPRIWLCADSLGNITHTFIPERGIIGGNAPPADALHGDRIFVGMQEEVERFLTSFGLSQAEAQRVVRKVGIAP